MATVALRRVRERVWIALGDTDARRRVFDPIKLDQALCDAYVRLQARLPAPTVSTASGLTISAGADTFNLPTTVSQWTGNNGGAEYRGDVRIRLRSTGNYLTKRTPEEIDSFREGQPSATPHLGIPTDFCLWKEKDNTIQGRCWTGARDAQVCDIFVTLEADDLRDFIGSATDDLDDVTLQLSRFGTQALIDHACARLLGRATAEQAAQLGIDKGAARDFEKDAEIGLHKERLRHHSIASVGRIQRWKS